MPIYRGILPLYALVFSGPWDDQGRHEVSDAYGINKLPKKKQNFQGLDCTEVGSDCTIFELEI